MCFYRRIYAGVATLFIVMLLAACAGSNAPQAQTKSTPTLPPTPTAGPGQQLLNTMSQKLNTASTLHGVFNVKISGPAFNGTVNSEIWNVSPNKNRTLVLQSTVAQFPPGSVTISNGKEIWQYDPVKKVVYKGPVTSGAAPANGGQRDGQSQLILNIVRTVFTHSDATLVSSSVKIDGQDAYDLHVVSQGQAVTGSGNSGGGFGNFSYSGEMYIAKTMNLPLQMNLMIQGLGQVFMNIPMLALNQPVPESTFTFDVPAGVKVLPLQQANATPETGSLTLNQAQQQAGYHLLSISSSQTDYVLGNVNALGAPGNQIYTLSYTKGSSSFTIAEGKALANLPSTGSQQVSLRGTTGAVSATNGATTLSWTEKGVGITITGNGLSSVQLVSIAQLLS
jgi:outer membrane lipoprotein-sorting protein